MIRDHEIQMIAMHYIELQPAEEALVAVVVEKLDGIYI
jgi:hypothetical protein